VSGDLGGKLGELIGLKADGGAAHGRPRSAGKVVKVKAMPAGR
jgi:hypothetical protein